MSDVLRINTEEQVQDLLGEKIEPLPLYDDKHPFLKMEMPEYTDVLPNPAMTLLCKRLRKTMREFGGVGLSANQCGVLQRVFIIGTEEFNLTCINPKVIQSSPDMVRDNEGCLSFPGLYVKISRPSWVEVEYTTETGVVTREKFNGVTARCFLHELDHMNGKTFVELVGPTSLMMAQKKKRKLINRIKKSGKQHGVFV